MAKIWMENILADFLARHTNIINLSLHIVGIPLAIAGIAQLFFKKWEIGILLFVLGYLLQWAGHTFFEHNQMGEVVLILSIIKKIRGA